MKLELSASAARVTQLESQIQQLKDDLNKKIREIEALQTTEQGLRERLLNGQQALSDEKKNGEQAMKALRENYRNACEERAGAEKERSSGALKIFSHFSRHILHVCYLHGLST